MKAVIDLQSVTTEHPQPELEDFQLWIDTVFMHQKCEGEICLRIVDSEEVQNLNDQYRDKDKATNVLAFPFEAPPEIKLDLLGDLVICAKVVNLESVQQNKPYLQHWAHIVIHGSLHLLGYDHIKDVDAEQMEDLEREILQLLDIPDPYATGK